MSRRRFISSAISTDPRIAELAEHGALPTLLYTWAIVHADGTGRFTGDARQFRLLVCPGLGVTAQEVDTALSQIAAVGLWQRYTVAGKQYIEFDPHRWRREQHDWPRDERNALRHTLAPLVYTRDDYRCVYCGSKAQLTCEHIYPLSRGGSNELSNLVTCCRSCNSSKQARTPEEWTR